jgi:steroid delta-isomerase-like uncharacterized protein
MSNAIIARRAVENFNRHDASALAGLYSPAASLSDPQYPEPLHGRDAVRQDFEDLFLAFPDVQIELGTVSADGTGALAYEVVLRGTHGGPLATPDGPVPPTGRPITLRACHFMRIDEHGLIARDRRYYDLAGMLGQLGLLEG